MSKNRKDVLNEVFSEMPAQQGFPGFKVRKALYCKGFAVAWISLVSPQLASGCQSSQLLEISLHVSARWFETHSLCQN
jgi:hypothetical protein